MAEGAIRELTAVVPAFDEEAVIADVARRANAAMRAAGISRHEVVVVDDGSRDETAAAVRSVAADTPSVRLVRRDRNGGYGAALRTGFAAARYDVVWILDGDGQFDPADLPLLIARYRPRTVVAGFRGRRRDGVVRRVGQRGFFGVVRTLVGPLPRDVDCAFKLVPRELTHGLTVDGAMISTELLLRARRAGYAVAEVNVPHHPRVVGVASGSSPRVVARAVRELWAVWRADRRSAAAPAVGEVAGRVVAHMPETARAPRHTTVTPGPPDDDATTGR